MALVIGCDPGLTGALAVVDGEALVRVDDMPVRTKRVNGSDRNVIDEQGLRDWLMERGMEGCQRAVIERVGGLPGQSASRAFTFGYGFGVLLSTARMLGFEVELVTPQEWKGKMLYTSRESRLKAASFTAATKAFGNEHWKRKMDHGRAEAALIALYGVKHVWGGK